MKSLQAIERVCSEAEATAREGRDSLERDSAGIRKISAIQVRVLGRSCAQAVESLGL
jgi:hypothetical protein